MSSANSSIGPWADEKMMAVGQLKLPFDPLIPCLHMSVLAVSVVRAIQRRGDCPRAATTPLMREAVEGGSASLFPTARIAPFPDAPGPSAAVQRRNPSSSIMFRTRSLSAAAFLSRKSIGVQRRSDLSVRRRTMEPISEHLAAIDWERGKWTHMCSKCWRELDLGNGQPARHQRA